VGEVMMLLVLLVLVLVLLRPLVLLLLVLTLSLQDGWPLLHHAASRGHAAVMSLLIQYGAHMDSLDSHRSTSLMVACGEGQAQAVALLLDNGADIHAVNEHGEQPLALAKACNDAPARIRTLRVLQTHRNSGVEIEIARYKNVPGDLCAAIGKAPEDRELVAEVLATGKAQTRSHSATANAESERTRDEAEQPPLVQAAARGYGAVVSLLLASGASIVATARHGESALSEAAGAGSLEICTMILDHDMPSRDARQANGSTVPVAVLKAEVVNMRSDTGWTALHQASRHGYVAIATLLLSSGADINPADSYGWTPLMCAARFGHAGCVGVLLGAGADVERMDEHGETALMEAVMGAQAEVVALLFAHGVSTSRDRIGKNALDHAKEIEDKSARERVLQVFSDGGVDVRQGELRYAVACEPEDPSRIRAALASGLDPNAQSEFSTDGYGRPPLLEAANRGHMSAVLLLLKGDAATKLKADPVLHDKSGVSALLGACIHGHRDLVELLLDHKAGTEVKMLKHKPGKHELNADHPVYQEVLRGKLGAVREWQQLLKSAGHDTWVDKERSEEKRQALWNKVLSGSVAAAPQWRELCKKEMPDVFIYSALSFAVINGHVDIVALLLSHHHGANLHGRDHHGHTAHSCVHLIKSKDTQLTMLELFAQHDKGAHRQALLDHVPGYGAHKCQICKKFLGAARPVLLHSDGVAIDEDGEPIFSSHSLSPRQVGSSI